MILISFCSSKGTLPSKKVRKSGHLAGGPSYLDCFLLPCKSSTCSGLMKNTLVVKKVKVLTSLVKMRQSEWVHIPKGHTSSLYCSSRPASKESRNFSRSCRIKQKKTDADLQMVAKSISHHLKLMVETITLVGIYVGESTHSVGFLNGGLKWISSSMARPTGIGATLVKTPVG